MNVQNHVQQIKENGYCIIPNVISNSECKFYRDLLELHASNYSQFYFNPKGKVSEYALEDKKNEKERESGWAMKDPPWNPGVTGTVRNA